MSHPKDVDLIAERKARIENLERGALCLEARAHELILEASDLRKLASKLASIEEPK